MSVFSTSQTLLQRIHDKEDHEAWEEFVMFYKRFIYVTIRNMNVSESDTKDLSQKVLIKVLNNIHKFKHEPGKHAFRNWLYRVTKNTVLNYITQKKSHLNVMVDSERIECDHYLDNISVPEIDYVIENEWKCFLYNYAFEVIKDQFQENVIHTFELIIQGYNSKDIAQKMNLNQNTVYTYKKRVQTALKKEIDKLTFEHGD